MAKSHCLFCSLERSELIKENNSMMAIEDKYPVTKHHILLIPKIHRLDFFDLTVEELNDYHSLLNKMKDSIIKKDKTITGFNIGMNCGASAGQTVFHCHIHLIPRRNGDMNDPAGGVRGVIPHMQKY